MPEQQTNRIQILVARGIFRFDMRPLCRQNYDVELWSLARKLDY
jgi:hypothetical protein